MAERKNQPQTKINEPRPPFPEQPQQFPGTEEEMQPKPDHGEQSYKGTGKLLGRAALITGADSGIGKAVAIAFAALIPYSMPKQEVENFGKSSLFSRPAQPAEIAPIFVFMASPQASYVTGEVYGVTGGKMPT